MISSVQEQHTDVIYDIVAEASKRGSQLQYIGYHNGRAGLALFYSHVAHFTGEPKYIQRANNVINEIMANLSTSLYKGYASFFYRDLAQLGMVIRYMEQAGQLNINTNDLLHTLDSVLHRFMLNKIAEGDLYQITGALAAGHYFLSRTDQLPEASLYLQQLIDGIERTARTDREGNYYWQWPHYKCDGVYLGLHCGSAMIINFLAGIKNYVDDDAQIKHIIEKASSYIVAQKRSFSKSHFPIKAQDPIKINSLLLGDLGIGYGLLRASQLLNNSTLEEEALTVLYDCCKRQTAEETLIHDASIFYGASGTALLFERIFDLTHQYCFSQSAQYWHQQVPAFRHPEHPHAGFKAIFNQKYPYTNICFNEGILGIGIALMRNLTPFTPSLNSLLGYL
uniref:Lanthionine synthetase LanC family protein n=1 Tax=Roseihalotalea indica TaxID=2867963 RepID=A0AA49GI21_9BACT|nr:lanthionine synthetase LanC family protein [Tunicatimonas sp. TK19036]